MVHRSKIFSELRHHDHPEEKKSLSSVIMSTGSHPESCRSQIKGSNMKIDSEMSRKNKQLDDVDLR